MIKENKNVEEDLKNMFKIKRKTIFENRYHENMGRLITSVTRVYLTFLNLPIKLIHKYRTTYNGEVKDCKHCKLEKI